MNTREIEAQATDKGLTPRLAQVAALTCLGLSDLEIAQRLGLSRHSVHEYQASSRVRLGVDTRGKMVALLLGVQDVHSPL